MNELVVIDPEGNVRRYPLGFEELVIGRDPGNAICLDDGRVSRKHARVYRGEKGHFIEDLGSANGVVLDGNLIRSATLLVVGNKIEVGEFVLTIVPEGAAHGAMTPTARLRGMSGQYKNQEFAVTGPRTTVGRVDGNQIVIDDASVSRHHARLQRDKNNWLLADLGSSNGTFVNDRPITQKELRGGEKITFGSIVFRFMAADSKRRFVLPAPLAYAIAISVVVISLAVALALVMRPASPHGDGAVKPPSTEVSEGLALGKAALTRHDWDGAIKQFDRVLAKDLTQTDAKSGKAEAEEGRVHEQLLRSAEQSAARGDRAEAVRSLARIPASSPYADQAQKMNAALSQQFHAEAKNGHNDLRLNGDEESALKARYPNPKALAAAQLYARGDFDAALVAFAPKGKALDAAAAESMRHIRAVRAKETDGAVAAQQTDASSTERALKAWDEALAADLEVVPANVRSQPRLDVRRMIGEALYRVGYYQFNHANFVDAFSSWKRGNERSPDNLDILAGLRRLDTTEENALNQTVMLFDKDPARACQVFHEVANLTLDTSPVHARALAKISEKCGGK